MRTTRRSQQRAAVALLGISLLNRSPPTRVGCVRHFFLHHFPQSSTGSSVTVAAAALSTGPSARRITMSASKAHSHGRQQQVRIFCYGDSLTAGTSPPLSETFPYGPHLERVLMAETEVGRKKSNIGTNANVAPRQGEPRPVESSSSSLWPESIVVRWRGLPGWTASTMLQHVDDSSVGLRSALRNVRDPNVELAVILAGTNDLGYEISSPTGAAERIADAVIGLHQVAHGEGVPTMAVSIPSSSWQHSSSDARRLADDVNAMIRSWCAEEEKRENVVHFVDFPFGWGGTGDDNWATDGLHLSPKGYRVMGELLAPAVGDLMFPQESNE